MHTRIIPLTMILPPGCASRPSRHSLAPSSSSCNPEPLLTSPLPLSPSPPPSAPFPPPLSTFSQAPRQDRRRKSAVILHHPLSHEKQHSTSTVHSTQQQHQQQSFHPLLHLLVKPFCLSVTCGLWCSASRSTFVRGRHRKSQNQRPSRSSSPHLFFCLIFFLSRSCIINIIIASN